MIHEDNVVHNTCGTTGWRRCLKLQVIFRKRATNYKVLLRTMIHEDNVVHNTCGTTGWRRPIGCLKLQVIFCKRATNYRALLRKMIYEDKISYGSTPPCSLCAIASNKQENKPQGIVYKNRVVLQKEKMKMQRNRGTYRSP